MNDFLNILFIILGSSLFTWGFYYVFKHSFNSKKLIKNGNSEKPDCTEEIIKLYTYLADTAYLYKFYTKCIDYYPSGEECFLIIEDPHNEITYKLYIGYTIKNNTKIKLKNCFSKLKIDKLNINLYNITIPEELYIKLYNAFIYPLTNEYKLKKLNTDLIIGIKNE